MSAAHAGTDFHYHNYTANREKYNLPTLEYIIKSMYYFIKQAKAGRNGKTAAFARRSAGKPDRRAGKRGIRGNPLDIRLFYSIL